MKIQIMGGKVCLRCKSKTLLGLVNIWKQNVCQHHPGMFYLIKGQLISKGLSTNFIWTKKRTKNFCPEDMILSWVRAPLKEVFFLFNLLFWKCPNDIFNSNEEENVLQYMKKPILDQISEKKILPWLGLEYTKVLLRWRVNIQNACLL